jgi:hypothetical protein
MSETPLSLNTIDYPFETLVSRANAIPPKLILNPDFQRTYKWDKEGWGRASSFIESCLMRIPLPSCYFAEKEGGRTIVIDGVQRITTIIRFFNDEFALEGLTAFPHLEGKKFSDLGDLRSELETTTIRCIVLRKDNPDVLVTEIFARLNQGAVELSDQEIRHALYSSPFDELLTDLASIPFIENFSRGKSGKAKRDSRESEELVLRFFAFRINSESYGGKLSEFLDQFMKIASLYNTDKIHSLEDDFKNCLDACFIVFNEDELFTDITKDRKRQGVVYYDLLMPSLGDIDIDILKSKRSEIREAYRELCSSPDFKKWTQGGIQKEYSINKRTNLWREKLDEALSAV